MEQNLKVSTNFQPGIFTMLTYDLLSLVDKGCVLPMDQFMRMCEDYTIMVWLKENTDYSYNYWDDDVKIIMAEEIRSLANCYLPERTYGISNNGILALAAFCQELINQKGFSRTRIDCDWAEEDLEKLGLIKN